MSTSYLIRYGHPFLEHTFLYHIGRSDHRHNFSPYFYPLYLSLSSSSSLKNEQHVVSMLTRSIATWAFWPQLIMVVTLAFRYAETDLPFTLFMQTFAFVTFNKVCTSQVKSDFFFFVVFFFKVI